MFNKQTQETEKLKKGRKEHDSIPLFAMIVDQERRIKNVSQTVLDFLDLPQDAVLGLREGEVLKCVHYKDNPEGCGFAPACDACPLKNTVLDTFRTRNSHNKIAADLSFIDDPVNVRNLLVSTVFLEAADDSVFVFLEDVTIQKKAQKALIKSEKKYRQLVENVPDLIYSFALNGGGIYYSPTVEQVLGYSPEYLLENPFLWHDSIHPDDIKKVDDVIKNFKQGKKFEIEYRIKDAKGSWHWLLDRSAGREQKDGEIIIEGIATDITQRKLIEEVLVLERKHLKNSLKKVKLLSGLLPICASCKKIRDDKGYWNQIEAYIHKNSEAEFSHSMCPECCKNFYPELDIFNK